MQIDTRNRDGSMQSAKDGFHPDPTLVPKAYAAPLTGPDAVYSGLLECPCTDRISKKVSGRYSLQANGAALKAGLRRIVTYTECYSAVASLGLPAGEVAKAQGSDKARPAGCSVAVDPATGKQSVFFNHLESAAPCGGAGSKASGSFRVAGAASSLVELGVDLDSSVPGGNATITITGPATVWFGVAFGATEMKQQPGAIIVDGRGAVSEYQLGDHVAGAKLKQQVAVLSNMVAGGKRTIVLTRKFAGASPAQFTFDLNGDGSVVQFMNAVGSSANFSFHKTMSSSTITLARLGVPNCLCGEWAARGDSRDPRRVVCAPACALQLAPAAGRPFAAFCLSPDVLLFWVHLLTCRLCRGRLQARRLSSAAHRAPSPTRTTTTRRRR